MRKTLQMAIKDEGRDYGKVFLIREMPASQAEKWAIRGFLAMGKNGIEFPQELMDTGVAGIARARLEMLCKLPFDEAEVLLDEMMQCVSIMPNPTNPDVTRSLVEDDIEEIATRILLRIETFKLHAGFSSADGK